VHDRRVLALEQPHPPDLVREAGHYAGQLFLQDPSRLLLELVVDGAENRRDGDGPDLLAPDVLGDLAHLAWLPLRDVASVEFVPAVAEVDVATKNLAQAVRPIDHGRQRLGGGQPESD